MEGYGIFTDSVGNRHMTIANEDNATAKYSKNAESGIYIKGKLYGKGEIKYKNGNLYIGFLKGSKRDGYGEMIYYESESSDIDDKGTYKGNWRRNYRSGEGNEKFYY